jgi:hypothetical protein
MCCINVSWWNGSSYIVQGSWGVRAGGATWATGQEDMVDLWFIVFCVCDRILVGLVKLLIKKSIVDVSLSLLCCGSTKALYSPVVISMAM